MPSRRRWLDDRHVLAGVDLFAGVVRYRGFLYGFLEARGTCEADFLEGHWMSTDAAASGPDPVALVAPPPPPRRSRRPPKRLLAIVGGFLAAALVAGLLVWQPWSPRPIAPVSLSATSPTGTSVQLSWPAANGGATPDHYVILRDGAQVAEVPGDKTTWANTSLRPGDKFQYEVATRGGGWQSGPSPVATVTTLAPSPVGLKVASTYTSATLTWKPSPLGPAPDQYVVYDQGERAATLDGATTSYVERGLAEGTAFAVRDRFRGDPLGATQQLAERDRHADKHPERRDRGHRGQGISHVVELHSAVLHERLHDDR
jgi:hypothetical protein